MFDYSARKYTTTNQLNGTQAFGKQRGVRHTVRRVPRGAFTPGPGEYNHCSTRTSRYSSFGSSQRKPQYLDRQYPGPGMPVYPPADGHFPKYTGPVSSMGNAVTRPSSAAFSFGASDRDSSSRKGFPPFKQQKQNSSHSALRPQTSTDQARLSLQPCQTLCTQAPQPQSTLVSSTPRPQTTPSHKSLKYTWLRGSVSSRRPFRGALFRILMRKPLLWTGTSNSFSSNSLSTYA